MNDRIPSQEVGQSVVEFTTDGQEVGITFNNGVLSLVSCIDGYRDYRFSSHAVPVGTNLVRISFREGFWGPDGGSRTDVFEFIPTQENIDKLRLWWLQKYDPSNIDNPGNEPSIGKTKLKEFLSENISDLDAKLSEAEARYTEEKNRYEQRFLPNIIKALEQEFTLTSWDQIESLLKEVNAAYGSRISLTLSASNNYSNGPTPTLQLEGGVKWGQNDDNTGSVVLTWLTTSNHVVRLPFTLQRNPKKGETRYGWRLDGIEIGNDGSTFVYPFFEELAKRLNISIQVGNFESLY